MRATVIAVTILLSSLVARAQFRADIDLVTLDVCVRDTAGRFVESLTSDRFVILENGVPQQVTVFEAADRLPLNVVLLLDRSASMYGEKLDRARTAALEFASLLGPEDRLEIIAFNQRAAIVQAAGAEPSALPMALNRLSAIGSTALYDAMVIAANEIARSRRKSEGYTRDLVIVLSDGDDTASLVGFDEVLPVLRRSGALVYGLSLRDGEAGETLGATWPLQQLARDTGAVAVAVPHLSSLSDLYAQINQEVRQLYRLGYVSSDKRADGQWRQLSVRVDVPDARVRTRAGYYAARVLR
jgi:Ca-activated chloride channel family protein